MSFIPTQYNDPVFVYSLRRLVQNYNDPIVRVIRESDHVEVDVYADSNEEVSYDSVIARTNDTEATVLGEFLNIDGYTDADGLGEVYEGRLSKIYDQSAGAFDVGVDTYSVSFLFVETNLPAYGGSTAIHKVNGVPAFFATATQPMFKLAQARGREVSYHFMTEGVGATQYFGFIEGTNTYRIWGVHDVQLEETIATLLPNTQWSVNNVYFDSEQASLSSGVYSADTFNNFDSVITTFEAQLLDTATTQTAFPDNEVTFRVMSNNWYCDIVAFDGYDPIRRITIEQLYAQAASNTTAFAKTSSLLINNENPNQSGFLAQFPNAAAAYSVRSLTGNTGTDGPKVVRVRRDSDNVEVDVYTDSTGFVSLNSPIANTNEQTASVTVGYPEDTACSLLGEFVNNSNYDNKDGLSATTSATVVAWYDQSYVESTSLPLEISSDAAAAYSVRKVNPNYEGPLLKIRRDSDGETKDIYATVSGDLDIDSINEFVQAGVVGEDFDDETLLLDLAPDAAAAYSLRLLRAGYTGPLVRVRRQDGIEVDVYPQADGWFGLDSEIEEVVELGGEQGDSDAFLFRDFARGDNVTVCVWYNQANDFDPDWTYNTNNLQANAYNNIGGQQPKIYDATTGLILENGRPILESSSGNTLALPINTSSNYYVFSVLKGDTSAGVLFGSDNNQDYAFLFQDGGGDNRVANNATWSSAYRNGTSYTIPTGSGARDQLHIDASGRNLWYLDLTLSFLGSNMRLSYSNASLYPMINMQELIIYSTDQDTAGNRPTIEKNINNSFHIYGGWGATVETWYDQSTDTNYDALLDTTYGDGAAAAYSLRKLSDSYDGPLVRVRRDGGDQAEMDVYPDENGTISVSSPVQDVEEETTDSGHNNPTVGVSTFGEFIAGYDGKVVRWYDQANSNDAIQDISNNQPKIYDSVSGVIVNANGNASLYFDGDDKYENITSSISTIHSSFVIAQGSEGTRQIYGFGGANAYKNFELSFWTPTLLDTFVGNGSEFIGYFSTAARDSDVHLFSQLYDATNYTSHIDSALDLSQPETRTSSAALSIGARNANVMYLTELILYSSEKSNERPDIEKNINSYYRIYDFNDATQSTPLSQPAIYNSQGVITENGKAAVEFNGSSTTLKTSNLAAIAQPTTHFIALKNVNPAAGNRYAVDSGTTNQIIGTLSTNAAIYAGVFLTDGALSVNQELQSALFNGSSSLFYRDGVQAATGDAGTASWTGVTFGSFNNQIQSFWDGLIQEYIVYTSNQYTIGNRPDLEKSINSYYNIYIDNGATQTVSTNQPTLVSNGELIVENGKPAIYSVNNYLTTGLLVDTTEVTFIMAGKHLSGGNGWFYGSLPSGNPFTGFGVQTKSTGDFRTYYGDGVSWNVQEIGASASLSQYLMFQSKNTSGWDTSVNGTVFSISTPTDRSTTETLYLRGQDDYFHEFIVYDSNQSDNRSSIEGNINNAYSIYSAAFPSVLDKVPNAAAAYSVRRLTKEYNGPLLRVDNGISEKDIYPDFWGNLNTQSILDFLNSDANSTQAGISVWYDQSGRGNHAIQENNDYQPQIAINTSGDWVIIEENGKVAVDFNGTSQYFTTSSIEALNTDVQSSFSVTKDDSGDTSLRFIWRSAYNIAVTNNLELTGLFKSSILGFHARTSTGSYKGVSNAVDSSQNLISTFWNSSDVVSAAIDRVDFTTNNTTGADVVPNNHLLTRIGATSASPSGYWLGSMQEIIIYPSDQSSNRYKIEDDINSYFRIYSESKRELLLNKYPNAAAAYSLRLLDGYYRGPLVRVRRDDGNEVDVYPDYNNELSLDSLVSIVDTGANTTENPLEPPLNPDPTFTLSLQSLGEFVHDPAYDSSEPVSAYVCVWYDQSKGNDFESANNAKQTAASQQPKIYDSSAGALNYAQFIDTSSTNLDTNFTPSTGSLSTFIVLDDDDTSDFGHVLGNDGLASAAAGDLMIYTVLTENKYSVYGHNGTAGLGIIGGTLGAENLLTFINNGTGTLYIDGASVDSDTFATTYNANSLTIGGGNGTPAQRCFNGKIREVIIYNSDQSTNRTGIEQDINDHYQIEGYTPPQPLLDEFDGAAAAYSLRKLSNSYTGPLVRVRRDSATGGDDVEVDVYPDENGGFSLLSPIEDVVEISNGGATQEDANKNTLYEFVYGQSCDLMVVVWYDQSGNGNDAEQTTTSNQPKIYDSATGVVTKNGKPAVEFDGSNDSFNTVQNNPFSYTGEVSCVAAVYKNSSSYKEYETLVSAGATGNGPSNNQSCIGLGYGNSSFVASKPTFVTDIYKPSGVQYNGALSTNERQLLGWYINNWSTHKSTGLSKMTLNGSDVTTATYASGDPSSLNTNPIKIGVFDTILASSYFGGSLHELIIYTSDQSSNRTGIEQNINQHYNIY